MQFLNAFREPVVIFLFNHTDIVWLDVVRDPSRYPNAAFANRELVLQPGQSGTLSPVNTRCFVGVKREADRLGVYITRPTLDVYDDTASFEITAMPTLEWLNRPTISDPTPHLPSATLNRPLPKAPGLVVGVGRAEMTDAAAADRDSGLPMQGWGDLAQRSAGIESPLFARAFIVGEPRSRERVVFVICDIWSCSIALKTAVIDRLGGTSAEAAYRADNVHIAGTHTHSAPASFLHHFMYNVMAFGFDPHVFECYVRGIVKAIERAHDDLAPGTVYPAAGQVPGLTRNRSMPAFLRNDPTDQALFPSGVDDTMTLLRFAHAGPAPGDPEIDIGLLNWFAIHPTNRGSANQLINGDNKGWASQQVEAAMLKTPTARKGFVAAFANSSCGDVSGNFDAATPLGQFDEVSSADPVQVRRHIARMRRAGDAQATAAQVLFAAAQTPLTGPILAREQVVDMVMRTGAPGALGVSMACGSTEDGAGPLGFVGEGVQLVDPARPDKTSHGPLGVLVQPIAFLLNGVIQTINLLAHPTSLPAILGAIIALGRATPIAMVAAHFPKPILFMPGTVMPTPLTPNIVPIQVLRIGTFAVLGLPAEVTTVAGFRLQRAARAVLAKGEVTRTVVGAYANGYASYVTTPEEYEAQHYEGASTLFGAGTCEAYEKAFADLADAVIQRTRPRHDAPLPDLSGDVLTKRRMTFRNLS